jgi:DNA-binding transcriptional ArsR family regulator
MKEFLATAKALSDENRVRALMFLRDGDLCVCQIIEMLRLAPSTVSKHMAILHGAGLVEAKKEGRWIFYRLPDEAASTRTSSALRWVQESLADDGQVCDDMRRLEAVRRTPVKELCRHYKA